MVQSWHPFHRCHPCLCRAKLVREASQLLQKGPGHSKAQLAGCRNLLECLDRCKRHFLAQLQTSTISIDITIWLWYTHSHWNDCSLLSIITYLMTLGHLSKGFLNLWTWTQAPAGCVFVRALVPSFPFGDPQFAFTECKMPHYASTTSQDSIYPLVLGAIHVMGVWQWRHSRLGHSIGWLAMLRYVRSSWLRAFCCWSQSEEPSYILCLSFPRGNKLKMRHWIAVHCQTAVGHIL